MTVTPTDPFTQPTPGPIVSSLKVILSALNAGGGNKLEEALDLVAAEQGKPDADHQELADAEQVIRAAIVFRDVGRFVALPPAERAAAMDAS